MQLRSWARPLVRMHNLTPATSQTNEAGEQGFEPAVPKQSRKWILRLGLYGILFILLLAIALPNLLPPTACKNACINNVRQIDGAKQQWALEHKIPNGSAVSENDGAPYIKGDWPTCPGGGSYIIGVVGEPARCSI